VSLEPAGLCLHRGLGAVPEGAFADPRHEALGWRAYLETHRARTRPTGTPCASRSACLRRVRS
jgi:hypothetical protein